MLNRVKRTLVILAIFCVANAPALALERPTWHAATAKLSGGFQGSESTETDKLVQAAAELIRQEKFDEALEKCTRASHLSPSDHRPHVLSGLIYMAEQKDKISSDEFGKAIRLQPQNKSIYLLKAQVDLRRNASEEALADSRKALEIDPRFAEAFAMIGEILGGNENRRAEAISAYQSAINANPHLLTVYKPLAELLSDGKDQKGAEEVLKHGMAIDPNRMNCRFALGRMLVEQGRLGEAREIWDGRSSDDDGTMPQFIVVLKRAESLKKASDALAQRPNDPDVQVEMGLAVMDGDAWVYDERQQRAIVYFRNALRLKPNYDRAQYGICKGYIQIAEMMKNGNKTVDKELAKLRQLNPALADELVTYRKNYVGGLVTDTPVKLDK